ncbi:MAG: hypothetical protein LM576_06815 [Thermofilum sp.]|nr:hypothetical protein [Thermofilum sp.]
MISKIKVNGRVFENPRFVGFATYGVGDGSLMVIESAGKMYAISLLRGEAYPVVQHGAGLFVEIPYGGRTYRAPLRFKL